MADFTYRVSDTQPPMDLTVKRNGAVVDLTNLSGASVYIRPSNAPSGSAQNAVAGTATVLGNATAGNLRFQISGASIGSAGFSAVGVYQGQLVLSWGTAASQGAGIESIWPEFTVEVGRSYRAQ